MICVNCLEEAARDAAFSIWAASHGLGFSYSRAVEQSGLSYFTDADDDFLNMRIHRYVSGEEIPENEVPKYLHIRNIQAEKIPRYWSAYCQGIPPESSRVLPVCGCEIL